MKYPPITCYPYQANLLSVILNTKKAIPWYFNNFIQLEGPKKNENSMRIDFYSSLLWKTCPWLYYQRISRELVDIGWNSIVNFIIDSINQGYYIYFTVNTYFISIYPDYQKKHRIHDIFVYGYNNTENILFVADNFKNGIYSYEGITYNELKEGFNNITLTKGYGNFENEIDWIAGIELISFREKYGYDFDINLIISDLTDYISSKNSHKKYWPRSDSYWKQNCTYGIKIYDLLIDYIKELIDDNKEYDLRPFHVLYEHKSVMLSRIKYMGNNNFLNNYLVLYNKYVEIKNNCLVIRNFMIKSTISNNNKKILKKVKLLLSETKINEYNIIKDLLANIINDD